MNVCFELLDRQVVAGRADDLAVADPPRTYAQMVEEVAALGGALRALGVAPGSHVLVDLADPHRARTARLAVARIGGVVVESDPASRERAIAEARPVLRLDDDFDWEVAVRAGRTDPAAAENLSPRATYSLRWTAAAAEPALRSVADELGG